MAAARKRPEIAACSQLICECATGLRQSGSRQGVETGRFPSVTFYTTLQTFMGGNFVKLFQPLRSDNGRFIFGSRRSIPRPRRNLLQFYCAQQQRTSVSSFWPLQKSNFRTGPEFVMHYTNLHVRKSTVLAAAGFSDGQATKALRRFFAQTMPPGIVMIISGCPFQEQQAAAGVSPVLIFSFSVLCVFLILSAQFESWSLPFSVLLGTPTAILGAFLALTLRGFQNNVYVQIG